MEENMAKYLAEYRSYVKSFVEDLDADLATLENFSDWLEEEKYEQRIRCRRCDSLNTEQRGKIKHCTDCQHEDTISPKSQANWQTRITREEADRIRDTPIRQQKRVD